MESTSLSGSNTINPDIFSDYHADGMEIKSEVNFIT